MFLRITLLLTGAFMLIAMTALWLGAPARPTKPGSSSLQAKYHQDTRNQFPAGNTYSAQKAALGKLLFFDPALSRSSKMSCATCHNPRFAWENGTLLPRQVRVTGPARKVPTIQNSAWNVEFSWDGRIADLESQSLIPIENPDEMQLDLDELISRLAGKPHYVSRFQAVFPGQGITRATIGKALATFQRTVTSRQAPFDRWLAGDEQAMSESAKRGFALFNDKAQCALCHRGWRLTDDGYHDTGLKSPDPGRFNVTPKNPLMKFAFKTPGLRNIALRAPYMHDGSLETLDAVIRHYNDGFVQRPSLAREMKRLHLTEMEIRHLGAFMHALTDSDPQLLAASVEQARH